MLGRAGPENLRDCLCFWFLKEKWEFWKPEDHKREKDTRQAQRNRRGEIERDLEKKRIRRGDEGWEEQERQRDGDWRTGYRPGLGERSLRRRGDHRTQERGEPPYPVLPSSLQQPLRKEEGRQERRQRQQ